MSDFKPRRVARDSGRSDIPAADTQAADVPAGLVPAALVSDRQIAWGEAIPTETAPTIAPEVSAIAVAAVLAQHAPAAMTSLPEPTDPAAIDAWTALVDAHSAFARGFQQVAVEIAGLTRIGFVATTDAALALFGVRTFAEAIEINAGLARRGVDAIIEGSAKLSEIGVKTVTDASRPILSPLNRPRHDTGQSVAAD